MKQEVRIIDKSIAEELLKDHVNLRRLSETMVDEMKSDIQNGIFDKDQANVCLNPDGTLFYGQHILNAIIQLETELELNIYQLEGDEKKRHNPGHLNQQSKYKYHSER